MEHHARHVITACNELRMGDCEGVTGMGWDGDRVAINFYDN